MRWRLFGGNLLGVLLWFILVTSLLAYSIARSQSGVLFAASILFFLLSIIYFVFFIDARCDIEKRTINLVFPPGRDIVVWPADSFSEVRLVSIFSFSLSDTGETIGAANCIGLVGLLRNRGRVVLLKRHKGLNLRVSPIRFQEFCRSIGELGIPLRNKELLNSVMENS